ncbi:unnamed protein product [Phytomonas sp. Hart1]|nr:unnamed protein product [Phytomonas sp. Hart1]|eukprot:CCW68552.1 unnamed protein product [Phytomonas sp. isolate Hart1]
MNADTQDNVKRSITEAAAEHYELLLESRESNKRLDALSSEAIVKSNLLLETLGKLQFYSQNMADVGASWRTEKQILSNAMSNYPQLLAIAESPFLLRDCLCNGMYHQALLIVEHMSRITPRDANSGNLFSRIQLELWKTLDACFNEVILPRLSESLTVDVAYKLITFLEHLGFDKSYVRELFLERRRIYLDKLIQEAEKSTVPYSRAIKLIKLYKNQTNDVLMQYEVCFLPSERTKKANESKSETEQGWDECIQLWSYAQAERFLAAFAHCIGQLTNGSELALLVEQSSSCATRAAQVGMDLFPGIQALLISRIQALFSAQMAHTVAAYGNAMRGFSWRKASALRTSTVRPSPLEGGVGDPSTATQTMATPTTTTTANSCNSNPNCTNSSTSPTDTHCGGVVSAPPAILAQCLPLACAVNGLLTAFNFCRRVVMGGMGLTAVGEVEGLLARIADDLARDAGVVETLTALEQGVYYNFVRIFVEVLYPYVLGCTARLFGEGAQRWVEESMDGEVKALARRLPSEVSNMESAKISPPAQPSQSS